MFIKWIQLREFFFNRCVQNKELSYKKKKKKYNYKRIAFIMKQQKKKQHFLWAFPQRIIKE